MVGIIDFGLTALLCGLVFTLIGLVGCGLYIGIAYLMPVCKANEYINWFKIGRVKQFAKEKGIDIEKLIVEEELRNRNSSDFYRKLEDSWTKKISRKFAKELEPVETDMEELEEDKE